MEEPAEFDQPIRSATDYEDDYKRRFLDLVFPQEDQERMLFALQKFWDSLINVPQEEMPQTIVVPEISGRLAFTATQPIIDEIYKIKKIPKPPVVFMVATSVESRAQEHIKQAEEESKEHPYTINMDVVRKNEEQEKIKARSTMEKRAIDIIKHLKLPNNARVLLLDDYVSTGGSFQEIAAAFHKNPEAANWKFNGFALMGAQKDPDSPYIKNPIDFVPYKIGIIDPHINPQRKNHYQYASYGWEYRNPIRMWNAAESNNMVHPTERTLIMRPDFIGVTTDPLSTPRAIVDEKSPISWKQWIRSALKQTGKNIVQEKLAIVK